MDNLAPAENVSLIDETKKAFEEISLAHQSVKGEKSIRISSDRLILWSKAYEERKGDTIAIYAPVMSQRDMLIKFGSLDSVWLNSPGTGWLLYLKTGHDQKFYFIVKIPEKIKGERLSSKDILLIDEWFGDGPSGFKETSTTNSKVQKTKNVQEVSATYEECQIVKTTVCAGDPPDEVCSSKIETVCREVDYDDIVPPCESCTGGGGDSNNGGDYGGGYDSNPGETTVEKADLSKNSFIFVKTTSTFKEAGIKDLRIKVKDFERNIFRTIRLPVYVIGVRTSMTNDEASKFAASAVNRACDTVWGLYRFQSELPDDYTIIAAFEEWARGYLAAEGGTLQRFGPQTSKKVIITVADYDLF